jgi:phosphoribosyl 1,2-cyclic phosphodiesterase
VRVTYFGTRGSCPVSPDDHRRYGGNTSCVLVEVAGEPPLILDLGTGLRALGDGLTRAAQAPGHPLRASALLTHLHYDHILGLPFFSPLRVPGSRLDVYGPAQEGTSLHDVLAAAVRPPFFPVHVGELGGALGGELRFHEVATGPGATPDLVLGSVTVRARAVPHPGHTLGFRVEAGGRSVAYVPDHQAPLDGDAVDAGVLALCDGADLVIHDAQFTDDELAAMPGWGHSTAGYAVHVAAAAGARRLALFHHAPSHTDAEIDRMLSRARQTAAHLGIDDVTAAREGTSVDLGKP